MSHIGQIIEFSSPNFPFSDEDGELANADTMHGYRLAKHIAGRLPEFDLRVCDEIPEDWGWLFLLDNDGFELAYGVASYHRAEEFVIQFVPQEPSIRKWFKKIDVSHEIERLQDAVFAILQQSPDSTSGPEWADG